MKKGNSKNRHFSKGNSLKNRKRLINRKGCMRCTVKSKNVQLAEKSLKWNRIGIAIQLADFLIDKIPLFCKWLVHLLGMG